MCSKDIFIRRSIEDVCRYIESNFLYEVVSENCEENSYLLNKMIEITKSNINNYIKSNNINLESMEIKVYKLFNGKDNDFFKEFLEDNDFGDEFIIVILEKSSEFIYCSSSKLYSLLEIYKGISEDDVINNTVKYKHFLTLLEKYPEFKEIPSDLL